MEPIYANVILWAVFLFLGTIGYGESVARLLNRAEFNDFGWAAKAAVGMCVSNQDKAKQSAHRLVATPKLLT